MRLTSIVAKVVGEVRYGDFRTATKYVSPDFVVKATERKGESFSSHQEYLVTIGKPNYREREFIKKALEAGESFPIRKIQLERER